MKESIITFLVLIMILSGCKTDQPIQSNNDITASAAETTAWEITTSKPTETVTPIPGTKLICTVIPSASSDTDITVIISSPSGTTQTITATVSDDEWFYDPVYPLRGVYFSDADFDGDADILITHGRYGAQGVDKFRCFLQNSDTKTFTECPEYFDIANPKIDSENKVIRSTSRGSAVSRYYEIYNWENGTLNMLVGIIENITEDGRFSYEISDPEYSPKEVTADYYESKSDVEVIFSETP